MRYGLYFAPPPDHALSLAARSWLGRDAFTGEALATEAPAELIASPQRYGFHGTLKAPFRLAAETNEAALIDAVDRFSAEQQAFAMPDLHVSQLGPFFALTPVTHSQALDAMSAQVVEHFELFRAPLTEAEIDKRRPDRLSPTERAHLEQWGYPYVFDRFRFHMTLTGPVGKDAAETLRPVLSEHFVAALKPPLLFDRLSVFMEPEPGAPFRVLHQSHFGATEHRITA